MERGCQQDDKNYNRCMAYLRDSALRLDDKKSTQLINDFDHDPLTIKLLLSYLERWYDNQLSGLEHIPILHNENKRQGQGLKRLLVAFEHKLEGCAELTLLYLLSLSTKPVPQARMEQVFQRSLIKRLWSRNDDYQKFLAPLSKLGSRGWDKAFENLYSLSLLYSPDSVGEQSLHIEQRICQYFREKLEVQKYTILQNAYDDIMLASGMSTTYSQPEFSTSVVAGGGAASIVPPNYGLPKRPSKTPSGITPNLPPKTLSAEEMRGQLRALRYRLSVLKAQSRELNAMMLQSPAFLSKNRNSIEHGLHIQQSSQVA